MRRSGRSIAAIAAGTVLAGLGGLGLFAAWTRADADVTLDDPDAPIATAPATLPDFSAAPVEQAQAEVEVVRAPTPPPAVEYAQLSAAAIADATRPALRQAEALAWRYEPRIELASAEPVFGGERSEIALNLDRPRRDRVRTRSSGGGGSLAALRERVEKPRDFERKGRWFLFASDESTAVGLNILRNRSGELRRMSWSAERVAAIGDMQAGVGWRRGAFQAALSLVDREVSIYGESRDERFVAFTISIKPRGGASSRPRRHPAEEPSYYPPRAKPR